VSDLSMVTSWDEVAATYGSGDSPFGQFPHRLATWAGIEPGDRVVDLGCGNGLGLVALREVARPESIVGVDFSPAMLAESARRVTAGGGVGLVRADVMALPFPAGSFDAALSSSVFQFVGYSIDALREWRRVLAPGGRLAVSIPGGAREGDAPDVNLTLLREFFGRLPPATQRRFRERPVPSRPPDLADACRDAGFAAVTVEDVEFATTVASREDWWALQWTHGFRGYLREFDAATLELMKARAFELLEPRCGPNGEVAGRQVFRFCRAPREGRSSSSRPG
jgi:SAM-dependent methyltransferase